MPSLYVVRALTACCRGVLYNLLMDLRAKRARLQALLEDTGSLLVAYSGGTDSAFLAFCAYQALGERMVAAIADSASLPRGELAAALAFSAQHGIPTTILHTGELENPEYQKNDARRCFHCKQELFARMEELRGELGFAHLAYGMNMDDRGEFRPGQQAARQHHVLAPLVDAELSKEEIRMLAREAALSISDKPASACLSSRIEYGRAVTVENLLQVERAEDALHLMGFRQVRVRHHGELARIEIAREDLPQAMSVGVFERIHAVVQSLGFKYVTLDMHGYRSGSMNDMLPVAALTGAV
jgi:uncharacterized protein